MKHFIEAFLDLSNPEEMKSVESRVAKYLVETLTPEEFPSFSQEGDRYWVTFTDAMLKAVDFSTHEELNEFVTQVLASEFEDYMRCIDCGRIIFNYRARTYRGSNGCVGSTFECLSCRCLSDEQLAKVRQAFHTFGTGAAVQFILNHYYKAPACGVVTQLNHLDEEALKTVDGKLVQFLYETKPSALTLFPTDDPNQVIYTFHSSVLDELLASDLMELSWRPYVKSLVFEGFKAFHRCDVCGQVIYHESTKRYRKNHDGLLVPRNECAICRHFSSKKAAYVSQFMTYDHCSLAEASVKADEVLSRLKDSVVLANWTPIYGELGGNAVIIGNDQQLEAGTVFDGTTLDLNYYIIYGTDVEEVKQQVAACDSIESCYDSLLPFTDVMVNDRYLEDLADYRQQKAQLALERERLTQQATCEADLPF